MNGLWIANPLDGSPKAKVDVEGLDVDTVAKRTGFEKVRLK